MSLKDLAQQMKATGRKGDTELIHMTKREVAGLQALAEAAGGTLTTNPKTGLPEASFLERLLPTIIGIGLAPFTGGLSAAAIGAGTGALLNEEDPLMGAITGGLGAYGGASLGAGLSAAGTAGAVAPTTGAIGGGLTPGVTQGLTQGATVGLKTVTPTVGASGINYGLASGAAPSAYSLASGAAPMTAAALPATVAPTTFSGMGQGIQALFNNPSDAITAMGGGMNVAKNVGMGLAPVLLGGGKAQPSGRPSEEEDTEDLFGRYEYGARPTGGTRPAGSAFTGERVYFEPEYRRMYAAKGGEVKKFADGGEASASSSTANPARGMSGVSADAMNYLYQMDPAQQDGGASAEAMQYLMGQLPTTSRVQPAPVQVTPFVAPTRMRSTISNTEGYNLIGGGEYPGLYQGARPQYVFDPGSQQYFRTDPVFDYVQPVVSYYSPFDYGGGGGDSFGGFGGFGDFGGGDSGGDSGGVGDSGPSGSSGDGGASAAGPGDSWKYGGSVYAEGGLAALARGGMKAGGFVIPADVVSMVGEGNTDAGYDRIKRMLPGATPIKGKDGGQADTVATSIDGKQPARVAHGEMYVPPAAVKRAGGAKKLYAMMKNVRKQAKGDAKQIKPVNLKKAMA